MRPTTRLLPFVKVSSALCAETPLQNDGTPNCWEWRPVVRTRATLGKSGQRSLVPVGVDPPRAELLWELSEAEEPIGIEAETKLLRLKPGGSVLIQAPPQGADLVIIACEPGRALLDRRGQAVSELDPSVTRPALTSAATPLPPRRTVALQVLLHIERTGDRRLTAEGWLGSMGQKLRLEAFGILPLEGLVPDEVEYRGYGPNGRETPWVSGGRWCGSRGRGLPLTGFAIRLSSHQESRFSLEYSGAFFTSGICGPVCNGSPCIGRIADDPLEAINLRLFERPDQ